MTAVAPHPRGFRLARALLLAAAGISAALVWISLSESSVAGCGPSSPCQTVLASRWAQWFGLPVSLLAIPVYLGLAALTFPAPGAPNRFPSAIRILGLCLSFVILGAGVWFFFLQALVLKMFCPLCLTVHACAVAAACLWLRNNHQSAFGVVEPPAPQAGWGKAAALSLALLAVLIAGQLLGHARGHIVRVVAGAAATAETSALARKLVLHLGRLELPLNDVPLLGSPAAPRVAVCLFDYTCPHCRQLHLDLRQILRANSNAFTLVCLPVPMERGCNRFIGQTERRHLNACQYARLGVAVWKCQPGQFERFNEWFFTSEKPPALEDTKDLAMELGGAEAVQAVLATSWPDQQIERGLTLFELNLQSARQDELPQFMTGSRITFGAFENLAELRRHLEREFGLERGHLMCAIGRALQRP
jgi:uncharacterized membrane protein